MSVDNGCLWLKSTLFQKQGPVGTAAGKAEYRGNKQALRTMALRSVILVERGVVREWKVGGSAGEVL